jgi:hypothetical protein
MTSDGKAPGAWYRDTFLWQILAGIISAAPFAAFSFICLTTWIDPLRWGTGTVLYLFALMMTEFLVLHASGLITIAADSDAPTGRNLMLIGGIGMVYLLFGACWSVVLKTATPIVIIAVMIASRFTSVLLSGGLSPREKRHQFVLWYISCCAYLILAIAASITSTLPRLGMTAELVSSLHLPHRGFWLSEPHRVVAFGFVYFLILAIVELLYGPLVFLKVMRRKVAKKNKLLYS